MSACCASKQAGRPAGVQADRRACRWACRQAEQTRQTGRQSVSQSGLWALTLMAMGVTDMRAVMLQKDSPAVSAGTMNSCVSSSAR